MYTVLLVYSYILCITYEYTMWNVDSRNLKYSMLYLLNNTFHLTYSKLFVLIFNPNNKFCVIRVNSEFQIKSLSDIDQNLANTL